MAANGIDTVVPTLTRLQPLAALGVDSLRELAPHCHRERVTRNLDPFQLRDWQGQVVYLVKGELKLEFEDGMIQVIVGGWGDALYPIGRGRLAPTLTKAITDVEMLRFDEDLVDIMMTWDQIAARGQETETDSDATDWRTMSGMFTVQSLTQGVFASMPPANIEQLLGHFQRVPVKRGEQVIRQGDPGDYYYLIERGRCAVTREVAGATVELAELREGDSFGEEALVADMARNATVTMKTDGMLLRLNKTDFMDLLREPLLQRLPPAEAQKRIAGGAQWIDVRFPAEYQCDGLPGALNIPVNEIRHAIAGLDPDREYIVYCQTGRRSSAAAFLLSQRGLHAHLLDGGLKALLAAGATNQNKGLK
ncbi:MAG: cyclic nucleotide-binding domain-containing protein [Gammaproteobacteria bacterium]|nr:cyclic nucleotide-binding domain-containing protein [Gammaproteobacteria bacterium]MBU1647043.1 cyclic nucleotide-binding domain-containing protein [Gammaproteobacteria bacterium]MBU1972555.1 cyclic nucleotide-binding domain-containing protein [Gammaproteobacteria bacterium]